MPIPNLEDFTADLDRRCAVMLGEAMPYQAAGATGFTNVQAHVDYRDALKALEVGDAIAQDIAVAVLKVDVPAKPDAKVRLKLSKLPGRLFRPANVRSDAAGTEWIFELKDVPVT